MIGAGLHKQGKRADQEVLTVCLTVKTEFSLLQVLPGAVVVGVMPKRLHRVTIRCVLSVIDVEICLTVRLIRESKGR